MTKYRHEFMICLCAPYSHLKKNLAQQVSTEKEHTAVRHKEMEECISVQNLTGLCGGNSSISKGVDYPKMEMT